MEIRRVVKVIRDMSIIIALVIFGYGIKVVINKVENFPTNPIQAAIGYPRSPVSSPHGCYNGYEQNGLLCYPKCHSGFTGVGPVCWQDCPRGFRNDGAFCAKPAPYGRGAGYAWQFDDMLSRCERKEGRDCEMWGLIAYPKCDKGYYPFGCCICSPICPNSMVDIGVSCTKQTYGRGVGRPLMCKENEESLSVGTLDIMCFEKCKFGYHGYGIWCFPDN
jgi:hypothetical protein